MMKKIITILFAFWFLADSFSSTSLVLLTKEPAQAEVEAGKLTSMEIVETRPLDQEITVSRFKNSRDRVLIFDYDGTLAEFCDNPDEAIPSESLKKVLRKVNNDPKSLAAIVSGRPVEFLTTHFQEYPNLLLSAEHGAFERAPEDGIWKKTWEREGSEGIPNEWMGPVQKIMSAAQRYVNPELTPIETKGVSVVFHYRKIKDLPIVHDITQEIISNLSKMIEDHELDLIIQHDNCVVDVRPSRFSKGGIAVSTWRRAPNAEMVLCLGDSLTDESMFQELRSAHRSINASAKLITVQVKNNQEKSTKAENTIADVPAVISLLKDFYALK